MLTMNQLLTEYILDLDQIIIIHFSGSSSYLKTAVFYNFTIWTSESSGG